MQPYRSDRLGGGGLIRSLPISSFDHRFLGRHEDDDEYEDETLAADFGVSSVERLPRENSARLRRAQSSRSVEPLSRAAQSSRSVERFAAL
jgi:hypothetical protein